MLRRYSAWIPGVVLALILAGCLVSEFDEYTIHLNDDGKSGTITVVKRNVQSDQSDAAKQRSDFEELVQDWRGDNYLLEKTNQGVYVKDRQLWVEKGKLVWREVSIFSDFRRLFQDAISGDSVRIVIGKDEKVVRTNGDVVEMRDSTIVVWPLKARDFTLTLQKKNFASTSDFPARFRKLAKGVK